jgi:hypothetical protein
LIFEGEALKTDEINPRKGLKIVRKNRKEQKQQKTKASKNNQMVFSLKSLALAAFGRSSLLKKIFAIILAPC